MAFANSKPAPFGNRTIFKVSGATVKKTRRGYQIYELRLNESIVATKLLPLREFDKKYDELYRRYSANNATLDFLIGKYVSISLIDTAYGIEFTSIGSFDAISDFRILIENANGKAFCTTMNMYEFLKNKNYPVNANGSLTLKKPYDNFNLNTHNVCYPNNLGNDCLTIDNIRAVFDEFYKNKIIENFNPDCDEKFILTSVSIGVQRKQYHKSKSKTISSNFTPVLRIGDLLSEEQYAFVLGRQEARPLIRTPL